MGDYFFNKLPTGHAIRTLSLAATTTSLGNEPAVAGAVGTTVDDAHRQCAAVIWLLSDVFSKAAVLALPLPSRNYLIKLLGLPPAHRAADAQADRITAHQFAHHPTWTTARPATATATAALAPASRGATPVDLHQHSSPCRKWKHSWPSLEARS